LHLLSMVTYEALFAFCALIIALVGLMTRK
jgi:hypothetical protein